VLPLGRLGKVHSSASLWARRGVFCWACGYNVHVHWLRTVPSLWEFCWVIINPQVAFAEIILFLQGVCGGSAEPRDASVVYCGPYLATCWISGRDRGVEVLVIKGVICCRVKGHSSGLSLSCPVPVFTVVSGPLFTTYARSEKVSRWAPFITARVARFVAVEAFEVRAVTDTCNCMSPVALLVMDFRLVGPSTYVALN
jgi:hypothetical protein